MPHVAPRPSQSAEAARAAVLTAEFNEKRWVWVPDEKEGFVAAWVIREDEDTGEVMLAGGNETRSVPLYALCKMNPPKFDRVDDIADLTYLNEASVVHNLRLRYGSGAIYTYSGLFLVAINPYTNLPLYTDAVIQQYRNKRKEENPPHIYSITEQAWVSMGEERENQSILITGESGAGKTENTKKVIQYLAAIAAEHAAANSPSTNALTPTHKSRAQSVSFKPAHRATPSQAAAKSPALGLLERQILQANPILEAFGNAQTQRNNNSSRFGKFVRISFARDSTIAGANIDWYLLEKSRVTSRSEVERTFHVFYQLLEGAGALRSRLLLDGTAADYAYLNKSSAQIDGVDDREEWRALKAALDVVGFSADEQFNLFRIIAAILHIGNIEVGSDRSDQAHFSAPSQVEKACHLLGIPVAEFTKAVLRPRSLAGREWVTQARTKQQALDELSSLSKTLYEKSFGAMVERINKALDRPSSKATFIGVLDIAGFEIFQVNSFEQLCINYTNERLQQFFNHHMFVLEQEEYARESIDWTFTNFGLDLQPTIDLIESREPIGILSLLDEECIMPRATDATFTEKLNTLWSSSSASSENGLDSPAHAGQSKYAPTRFTQGFVVQHYAGKVEYNTAGWLEKNKDPLNDNLTRVLSAASERYVAQLFADYADSPTEAQGPLASLHSHTNSIGAANGIAKKRVLKRGAFRTVSQRHKEQLTSLMTQLRATQPHFVRCIVPNTVKRPGRIDVPLVLDQLRCNGVLEGIRIARLGYPNRMPFAEFRQSYELLTPGILPRGYMDGRKACARMIEDLDLDQSSYAIGNSKIFFKAGVLAVLEERRDALLFDIFSRLQAAGRRFTARRQIKKILNRAAAVKTIQRNARIYGDLRDWEWWQLYTKVRPLLTATRNDEELKKKEVELALVRERAERDEKEKQAMAALKMQVEQEKRKLEEELAGERELVLDKQRMFERSKTRETELVEEVARLEVEVEQLDNQLERAMASQKAGEDKYRALKAAFDEAADHLVRLEAAEKEWSEKERLLFGEKTERESETEELAAQCKALGQETEELKLALSEKQEDIDRVKKRLESSVADLEARVAIESKAKELATQKLTDLEREHRQSRDELTELTRTTTDYETILQRKEAELSKLSRQFGTARSERDSALKRASELEGRIDALTGDLKARESARAEGVAARAKLEEEIDELRTLLNAKTSEDTKRSEAEKSREQELGDLRSRITAYQQEIADNRRRALEEQNKLKVDLEALLRQHKTTSDAHKDLQSRSQKNEQSLATATSNLQAAEKAKKTAEAELHDFRAKHLDSEGQLAEALKAKETLERQLAVANSKHQDFEDAVLQIERQKAVWVRQMDALKQQLDAETGKRTQIEQAAKLQKREFNEHKDRLLKLERDLKKALDDLSQRDWEVQQLRSKQDKTIVEHVHVLEEAKRVTDRQLADTQKELVDMNSYVKSLEKAKSRLTLDAEDLTRQTERERLEIRSREKSARAQDETVTKLQQDAEAARKAKDIAELATRRAESEAKNLLSQIGVLQQQLSTADRSKAQLEREMASLITRGDTPTSERPKTSNGVVSDDSSRSVDRLRVLVEQQQTQLRRLISTQMPKEDSFRARLLKEIDESEQLMQQELLPRGASTTGVHEIRNYGNVSPKPRSSLGSSRTRVNSLGDNRTGESDTSSGHRREVEALLVQQRAHQTELEDSRRQTADLLQSNKQLQSSVSELTGRLKQQTDAWNKETAAARSLESQTKGDRDALRAATSQNAELRDLAEKFKAQAESHRHHLDQAEAAKARAMRGEAAARQALGDIQHAMAEAVGGRRAADERALSYERHIKELEKRLESQDRGRDDTEILRRRMTEQLQEERDQYQKDLNERDFIVDQTRKKYQAELAHITEELQSQRETISRLREDNRNVHSELDRLQLFHDDEVYSGANWKKEKERLESKIVDVSSAYKSSTETANEQQSRIVNLLGQVRELRGVLDEAESDRNALQQARRNLEHRLTDIARGHSDTEKLSSSQVVQALTLEKQDLRSSLDEQKDKTALAAERLQKAEAHAFDAQNQLDRVRDENAKLDRRNADLEKQLKELNVRVVDQETKSFSSSPRTTPQVKRLEARVEELTRELQERRLSSSSSAKSPSTTANVRDMELKLMESERGKLRMVNEVKSYENKLGKMREAFDELQTSENELQRDKRRADREATEQRQKALGLEREVERLRARLERPSLAGLGSPRSSPRKGPP